jgi:hypothetical protein
VSTPTQDLGDSIEGSGRPRVPLRNAHLRCATLRADGARARRFSTPIAAPDDAVDAPDPFVGTDTLDRGIGPEERTRDRELGAAELGARGLRSRDDLEAIGAAPGRARAPGIPRTLAAVLLR